MKIAWLINLYPPYVMGGNEMIAKDVILELRNRGHRVYLLTGSGQQLPQDQYHLSPINLNLDHMGDRFLGDYSPSIIESIQWHIFDPRTYRATVQTLREIKPDLVVIDNFSLVSPAPLIAALRTQSRVVVRVLDQWFIHGLKVPGEGLWHCPAWQRPIITVMQRLTQPLVSHMARQVPIIANSRFIKEAHVRAGFKEEQLSVVHLGIDVETFRPNTSRPELGQPIRLMFAGMLWGGKGPQIAIQALAELKNQIPETYFTLDIYGKGTPRFQNYLQNMAKNLGVSDIVNFFGFVSQTELAQALHAHDIFLFTSIWDEPFSITLLQAMSSGIPVISTTVGGNPEAVEDGHTGLLVPPNNPTALARAIQQLVQDSTLRCKLGDRASAAVREKWSFKHYVDTLETLYEARIQRN